MTTMVKNYQDVLAAVRELMSRLPADAKPTKASALYWDIGNAMHMGLRQQETSGDAARAERFYAQVRRALDVLAKEGTLVKVGKGDRNVEGYIQSTPLYYTPAQYEHARDKVQQQRRDERAERDRWEGVYDKLETAGFTSHAQRGTPVQLELGIWEALLERLAKGNGGW